MRSDRLKQVGKNLGKTRKEAEYLLQRYSQEFPMIERMGDVLGELTPFIMEFVTEIQKNNVSLNLYFGPVYGITISSGGDPPTDITILTLIVSDPTDPSVEVLWPENVQVWLDNVDITRWVFGSNFLTPTEDFNVWRNVDISTFVRGAGIHKLKITCENAGKVQARVAIR
jgi:hypothetical protein